jgi:nucleoid DNA-binding protein
MTKKEILQELRSIIFDYQETMTKDTEQALKNLVDMIEEDIK